MVEASHQVNFSKVPAILCGVSEMAMPGSKGIGMRLRVMAIVHVSGAGRNDEEGASEYAQDGHGTMC